MDDTEKKLDEKVQIEQESAPAPKAAVPAQPVKKSHHRKRLPGELPGRPGRKPGSTNRPKSAVAVPEFKPRKPPEEIEDLHAAFARIHGEEKKLAAVKSKLAEKYKAEYGREIKVSEPVHPLAEQTTTASRLSPKVSPEVAAMLGQFAIEGFSLAFGVESRPQEKQMTMWAASFSNASKHFPLDDKILDYIMLGLATLAIASPALGELRAKKNGDWAAKRVEFEKHGFITRKVGPEA